MQKVLSSTTKDSTHCTFPASFSSAALETAAASLSCSRLSPPMPGNSRSITYRFMEFSLVPVSMRPRWSRSSARNRWHFRQCSWVIVTGQAGSGGAALGFPAIGDRRGGFMEAPENDVAANALLADRRAEGGERREIRLGALHLALPGASEHDKDIMTRRRDELCRAPTQLDASEIETGARRERRQDVIRVPIIE